MSKYYRTAARERFNEHLRLSAAAQTLAQVLKQCGDDLTRDNIMRQAANLKDLEATTLLPGIRINTSQTDFYPIEQVQLDPVRRQELGAVRRAPDSLKPAMRVFHMPCDRKHRA